MAAIAVFLCFFLLWLSFTANVRENAWEFGVLRAVGLSVRAPRHPHTVHTDKRTQSNAQKQLYLRCARRQGAQVIRCYVYEALAIIIAAVLTGALIGLLIAVTLTLQFNLFTEMPFVFTFPYAARHRLRVVLFCIVCCAPPVVLCASTCPSPTYLARSTTLFFSVLAMSVAVAVLGSYLPARDLRGKPISSVLKGAS